jgi:hypothetical protein
VAGWFYAPPPARQPVVHVPIASPAVQVQPAPRAYPWRVLEAWRDSSVTVIERSPVAQPSTGDNPPPLRLLPAAIALAWQVAKPLPLQRVSTIIVGSAGNVYSVSLAETGAASDTVASVLSAIGALTETGTAADAVSSVLTAVAVIAETASASDIVSTIASLVAQLSEAAAAADAIDGSVGSSTYSVSIIEAATAADTISSLKQTFPSLSETGTAADTVSSLKQTFPALSETGTAADSVTAAVQASGDQLNETGSAGDALVSNWTGLSSLAEVVAAIDSVFLQAAGLPPGNRIITVRATSRTVRVDGSRTVRVH